MSVKAKEGITKCLIKIENDSFDEDVIRMLLILSREYIKCDGLIKELAHFIAHNERSQGIFHKKVNNRYAKFNLIKEHVAKADINEWSKRIKTEDELSDFMLGGVSVDKIESKLFNVLYVDGLEDFPEDHLLKYTGCTKAEVRTFFVKFYTKIEGFYYLNTLKSQKNINLFRNLPLSKFDPSREPEFEELLTQAEEAVKKIRSRIDGIQKVIRGAIFFNSVFDKPFFETEIITAFTQVIQRFGIDTKYINQIKQKSNDILLCIMTLLHDSKFVFFDKNEGRIFLCFYFDYNLEEAQKENYNPSEYLYNNGVIALYISGKGCPTIPLFVSDLPIKNYLTYEAYIRNPLSSDISETIWTTASRVENILQLTKGFEQ